VKGLGRNGEETVRDLGRGEKEGSVKRSGREARGTGMKKRLFGMGVTKREELGIESV